MGDTETEAIAKETVNRALETAVTDLAVIKTAEAIIEGAYVDAAASIERAMKMEGE